MKEKGLTQDYTRKGVTPDRLRAPAGLTVRYDKPNSLIDFLIKSSDDQPKYQGIPIYAHRVLLAFFPTSFQL